MRVEDGVAKWWTSCDCGCIRRRGQMLATGKAHASKSSGMQLFLVTPLVHCCVTSQISVTRSSMLTQCAPDSGCGWHATQEQGQAGPTDNKLAAAQLACGSKTCESKERYADAKTRSANLCPRVATHSRTRSCPCLYPFLCPAA